MRVYKGKIPKKLPLNGIYVFGSNTEGRHGKGSALEAKLHHGAIYGQAKGRQGNSYAIITKDLTKPVHPSIDAEYIADQIQVLYDYARVNKDLTFFVAYTAEAVNLNGYSPKEMANMFAWFDIPSNIVFQDNFSKLLFDTTIPFEPEPIQLKVWITYSSATSLIFRGLENCHVWFSKPLYTYISETREHEDDLMPFGDSGQKRGFSSMGWHVYDGRKEQQSVSFGKVFGYGDTQRNDLSDYVWRKICGHFKCNNLREFDKIEKENGIKSSDFCLELNLSVNFDTII